MKFPRNTRIFRGQLDAAPFAGVLFLLLIFLLLNSALVFTPGVPIQLPEGMNLPGTTTRTLVVAVDENGQFYFENQIVTQERLADKLRAAISEARQPLTLVIQADKKVIHDKLMTLWLLARSAGIKEIIHAIRPPVIPAVGPSKSQG